MWFFLKIARFSINACWLEYIQSRAEKINLGFNYVWLIKHICYLYVPKLTRWFLKVLEVAVAKRQLQHYFHWLDWYTFDLSACFILIYRFRFDLNTLSGFFCSSENFWHHQFCTLWSFLGTPREQRWHSQHVAQIMIRQGAQ